MGFPWKGNATELDSNEVGAKGQLARLAGRLLKNAEQLRMDNTVIRYYMKYNFAEKVEVSEVRGPLDYMLHQAVTKEERETTKVCIVFDASSSATGKPSFDDALHQEPNLNPNVLRIILRFRTLSVVVTSNIEKAFLKILLSQKDYNILRSLWYETTPTVGNNLPPVEVWHMKCVPFGATSSLILLAVTLHYHLKPQTITSRW